MVVPSGSRRWMGFPADGAAEHRTGWLLLHQPGIGKERACGETVRDQCHSLQQDDRGRLDVAEREGRVRGWSDVAQVRRRGLPPVRSGQTPVSPEIHQPADLGAPCHPRTRTCLRRDRLEGLEYLTIALATLGEPPWPPLRKGASNDRRIDGRVACPRRRGHVPGPRSMPTTTWACHPATYEVPSGVRSFERC